MRLVFGILFSAGPFVAGAIAAASARRDYRIIAMALAATIVAWLFRRRTGASTGRVILAFALATVAAAAVAVVAGARGPFGVVAVAVVLAAFATIGSLLLSMPAPRRTVV